MSYKIQRQLLKHIIVFQRSNRSSAQYTFDIGFVTYDQKYAEYEFTIQSQVMTRTLLKRFRQLFQEWQITPETDINITDCIDRNSPIRFYFEIAAQQMGVPIKSVSVEKMTSRFRSLYPQWYGDYRFVNGKRLLNERKKTVDHRVLAMWDGFVRLGKCPWITPAVDEYLKQKASPFKMRKKIVRLLAWYLVYRLHILDNSRKSCSKRLKTQNINTDHKE